MYIPGPKYPIGIQSFENIREGGYIYVDKTQYIPMLLQGKYYFMSRPRRFGKSLFLSTLEAYFQGRKDLFEGLAVSEWEKDWETYPIVHIDFNTMTATDSGAVLDELKWTLEKIAEGYGVEMNTTLGIGVMFSSLLDSLCEKFGKKVVILIDEYDKGFLEVLHDEELLKEATSNLRPFFNVLKTSDRNIKFAFITGVSRFRNTTVFSGFNNPSDLSFAEDYAGLFGLTQDEREGYFKPGSEALAEKYGYDYDTMLTVLKNKYDGYRFTAAELYVYNPFSVLNVLSKRMLEDAWVQSGSSRILKTYLRGSQVDFTEMTSKWVSANDLQATYTTENPLSLFFQTGYLTIRDFDDDEYKLGIPNQEVQTALVELVIPEFVENMTSTEVGDDQKRLRRAIKNGDVDVMMEIFKAMLSSVPYHEIDTKMLEKHVHLCMYIIFMMLGVSTKCEIAQSGGRVDMVARTPWRVYVFEFKVDGSAEDALRQIDEKGYALPWSGDGLIVTKIGANFSSTLRTVESWVYETNAEKNL